MIPLVDIRGLSGGSLDFLFNFGNAKVEVNDNSD